MRFGIREICNVVFKCNSKTGMNIGNAHFSYGQPVFYIDTAKTSELSGETTTVYAQGGRGNARLIAWEGERVVTYSVEDALISTTSLAVLTGAGAVNVLDASSSDKIFAHHTFDVVLAAGSADDTYAAVIDYDTAAADGATSILGLVKTGTGDIGIFGTVLDDAGDGVGFLTADSVSASSSGVTTTEVTIRGKAYNSYALASGGSITVVFDDDNDAAYVGKTVRVDCYLVKTSGARQITIDAEHFSSNFYVEAETLFREEATGQDVPAILVFPNVKIQSNFTFSMAASGDPSTFTFTMDAFPGYTKFDISNKVFVAIQILADPTATSLGA